MDGVGCGTQTDYKKYHAKKSNTLLNVYKKNKNFHLLNLENSGLNKILFNKEQKNNYCAGKINIETAGNDTFSSVWEMMGVTSKQRYRSKEYGLDKHVINKIEKSFGMPVIGNEYIAGFKAMEKYYNLHHTTGFPILYFAKDGIVLLAAHEDVIKPHKLHEMSKKLANLLKTDGVVRVIARPFIGTPGHFTRSNNRRDYVLIKNKISQTALERLHERGIKIITTEHIKGVLGDPSYIKATSGFYNNKALINIINKSLEDKTKFAVMIFCLQDFDTMGHKKDVAGYGKKLQEFDKALKNITANMSKTDLLVLTADHGCNPAYDMRGHTREKVPLIVCSKMNQQKKWLGERKTIADIGQTICYNFQLKPIKNGKVLNIF